MSQTIPIIHSVQSKSSPTICDDAFLLQSLYKEVLDSSFALHSLVNPPVYDVICCIAHVIRMMVVCCRVHLYDAPSLLEVYG